VISTRPWNEAASWSFTAMGTPTFFSGVWVTGQKTGRELFPSRAERALTDRKVEMELAVVHPETLPSAK
jgi:hypothetical protein